MIKVQIKSEKLTPFGGIFSIMEQFDSMLLPVLDSTLWVKDVVVDYISSARDIVQFYNLRGGEERIFDEINNGFG